MNHPTLAQKIGAIMLIAGTAIGAGMLGMPIVSGVCGFSNSMLLIMFCFITMLANLFLLLEATLYCKDPYANIIGLTREHLGPIWSAICWVCFMLLLYSILASYISAGGDLVLQIQPKFLNMSQDASMITFAILFSFVIILGVSSLDRVNRVLMLGLLGSFFLIVTMLMPFVTSKHLNYTGHPAYLANAFPIIAAAFTSHLVLPSVKSYVGNLNSVKQVLLIGSLVPLCLYVLWQLVVLGITHTTGPYSVHAIAISQSPISDFLNFLTVEHHLLTIGFLTKCFFLFAITTSFLGVLLSLNDFLADGFQVKDRSFKNRMYLLLLSITPPLFFALFSNSAFTLTLNFAGFFIAILYCIIPALVVIKCRRRHEPAAYKLPGGWPILIVLLVFGIVFAVASVMSSMGWLPHPA